jgi:hypothetical protein
MSWLLAKFGYRLRVCGGCRRYRIIRAHGRSEAALKPGSSESPEHGKANLQQHSEADAVESVQCQAEPVQGAAASAIPPPAERPETIDLNAPNAGVWIAGDHAGLGGNAPEVFHGCYGAESAAVVSSLLIRSGRHST